MFYNINYLFVLKLFFDIYELSLKSKIVNHLYIQEQYHLSTSNYQIQEE